MSAFAPLAQISGPDPTEFDQTTSFIRISMSNPASSTPPQVELRASNPATGTTGVAQIIDPVTDTSSPGRGLKDGPANTLDAASAYWSPPSHAHNVSLLKVAIYPPTTSLAIKITNNTAVDHDFVWVIGDSDANSQQPWMQLTSGMQLTPAALTFTALINKTAADT